MNTLYLRVLLVPVALACAGTALAEDELDANQRNVETIVVEGHARSLDAARAELELTPGGATLIDMNELKNRNVASLADALRYVPGVWSVSHTGSEDIFFSSRGSNLDAVNYDMNGIKLMQDGLPVTTADGNNHNRIVDPLAARYAVMARGANALKYGASTLGGAVDFVTPTALDAPLGEISLSGGSHGQMLMRATTAGMLGDAVDGLLTFEAKQWDGYRGHNEQERAGLYANAGWRVSDNISTRFYLTVLDNDQALSSSLTRAEFDADPYQAAPAATRERGHYQVNVETARLANKTTWQLGARRSLELGFSIERQDLYHPIVDQVLVDFDGPGPALPVEVFSLLIDTDHEDLGGVLRYHHELDRHDLVLGINYGVNTVEGGQYRNLHGERNGLTTLVDNDASSLETFAMDRFSVSDRTTLILAAQAVSATRDARTETVATGAIRNPRSRHSHVNPRFGVIRELGAANLYANLSQLYEPPTNYQLEDNVAGGSATLEAMQGKVVELGVRGGQDFGAASDWSWDVALYRAEIEDEILSVEDPSAPGTSLTTNVDHTLHQGVEALLRASFGIGAGARALETVVSLSVNDFNFDNDAVWGDNELPAAPEYVVRGELAYRAANGLRIGPTFDLVGARFADFVNSYAIPSYTLLGLRASWGNERLQAFAELHNLEDEIYVVSHSVRDRAGFGDAILNAGEPLSGYVGFSVKFD